MFLDVGYHSSIMSKIVHLFSGHSYKSHFTFHLVVIYPHFEANAVRIRGLHYCHTSHKSLLLAEVIMFRGQMLLGFDHFAFAWS